LVTVVGGQLRVEVTNSSLDVDGMDASNSVITKLLLKVTGPDGSPLAPANLVSARDLSGALLGGTQWGITEDGSKRSNTFNRIGEEWTQELSAVKANGKAGAGLCGGIVASGLTPDALPNSCAGDYYEGLVFVLDFGTADGVVPTNALYTAHLQNIGEDGDGTDWGTVTAPEPITVLLLATGLVGLGVAWWIRRRRGGVGAV
jgi:hypothetical protein